MFVIIANSVDKTISAKIVNISLSIYEHVLGTQKNRLLETVLFSTHNICIG